MASTPTPTSIPDPSSASTCGIPEWLDILEMCGQFIIVYLVVLATFLAGVTVVCASVSLCQTAWEIWLAFLEVAKAVGQMIQYLLLWLFWPVKSFGEMLGAFFTTSGERVKKVYSRLRGKRYRKAPTDEVVFEHDEMEKLRGAKPGER